MQAFFRKSILLFSFLLGAGPLAAQQYVISTKEQALELGGAALVTVTILNSADKPHKVPAELPAQLNVDGNLQAVTLRLTEKVSWVPAGSFVQLLYSVEVPRKLNATHVDMSLTGDDSHHLSFKVKKNADRELIVAAKRSVEEVPPIEEQIIENDGGPRLLDGLKPYEPIYFLAGFEPTDAKFQISLKYQLFNEDGRWATENPWLRGWHLGYTQVSFWDLASKSKPFEDTNFMPEVFYGLEDLKLGFLPAESLVDLQGGFMHESNGRAGENSRSLNYVYARVGYEHPLGDQWFWKATGKFWAYVGSLEDNPDIDDYRGNASFRVTAGKEKGIQLSAYRRGRFGLGKSSYLFDLTVPLARPGIAKELNFNLHGQLFTGYGENLLTYDQKETRFRIGLGIYR